jgi:pimeloyl-ACP methyl ester carboxylesterase
LARKSLPTDRPYVILGESFSGPVAVTLAAERPRGLVGLILCASFVAGPMPWLRPLEPLLSVLPVRALVRLVGPNRLFGRRQTPELRRLFFETARKVSTPVLRKRMREAMDVDVSSLIDSLGVPVTYIQATQDALLPRAVAERFSRAASRAKVIRIEAPHGVLQCAPREAARIVTDFVRGVS